MLVCQYVRGYPDNRPNEGIVRRARIAISDNGEGEAKTIEVPELLGKTKVEFCFHALEQMRIRGISEREVLATIRHPDDTGLPTQPKRDRVRKFKKPTKAIDVVYEVRKDRIILVTTFPKKFARS